MSEKSVSDIFSRLEYHYNDEGEKQMVNGKPAIEYAEYWYAKLSDSFGGIFIMAV